VLGGREAARGVRLADDRDGWSGFWRREAEGPVEHARPADLDAIAACHLVAGRNAHAELLPASVLKKRGLPAFVREWTKMLLPDACEKLVARSRDAILLDRRLRRP
jgi:hypothetical protein